MARSRRASTKTQLAYFLRRLLNRVVGHLPLAHAMGAQLSAHDTTPMSQHLAAHHWRLELEVPAHPA